MEVSTVEKEKFDKQLAEAQTRPGFSIHLVPKNVKEAMDMAVMVSKSGLVPKEFMGRPEACFMAIGFGMELGIPPMQALQSIMVVNSRPSLFGDAAKAVVIQSSLCESFDEDDPALALKQGYGKCTVKRVGQFNPVTRTFSVEDAKRAGLLTKPGPWQQYPGRMLQMRARSFAMRDAFPDLLKGLAVREEVEDYDTKVVEPVKMPERVKEKAIVEEAQVVGDAQEPVEPEKPVESKDALVDDKDRKELFKMRSEAGISVADTKEFLMKEFGVSDTGKLTKRQSEILQTWFVRNAKK